MNGNEYTKSFHSWLDLETSLYKNHRETIGRTATFRQILLTEFIYNLNDIINIRSLDKSAADYEAKKRAIKDNIQCYACNLMENRKGKVLQSSGLIQLDFDKITEYDIDELKQAVFDLPFIAFCGLSVSGDGFYALASISEPDRIKDYAEHCFEVLDKYSIPVDTSKGRNANDLRYVSYDGGMLIRDDPKPLKIKQFKTKKEITRQASYSPHLPDGIDRRIEKGLKEIAIADIGNRWPTVRRISYTLGGISSASLQDIKNIIIASPQYSGNIDHYLTCAADSFEAGSKLPII